MTKAGAAINRIVLQRSEREQGGDGGSYAAADAPTVSLSQVPIDGRDVGTDDGGRLRGWLIAWLSRLKSRTTTAVSAPVAFDRNTAVALTRKSVRSSSSGWWMPWLRLLTGWRVVITCTW